MTKYLKSRTKRLAAGQAEAKDDMASWLGKRLLKPHSVIRQVVLVHGERVKPPPPDAAHLVVDFGQAAVPLEVGQQ